MNHRPGRVRSGRLIGLLLLMTLLTNGVFAQATPPAQPPEPAQTAGQTYQSYLPMVAAPGGLSSAALIDQALANGEIDSETALLYRVFANYHDPRLPARFQGDDSVAADHGLMAEVEERLPQLSPAAQETLYPFFIPPFHAGSWWDLQRQPAQSGAPVRNAFRPCDDTGSANLPFYTDWNYIDSSNGQVRIWWQDRYPEDAAKARALAEAVNTIWGYLYALMLREPPSDGGGLRPCRGGSDRYDISLVDITNNGEVTRFDRHDPKPGPWPTFMLIRRDFSDRIAGTGVGAGDVMRASLIHELMHSFQKAFYTVDLNNYFWWNEASANWAIHYVERLEPGMLTNYEHHYAMDLLKEQEVPLEIHTYSAYLFPFFLQLRSGGQAAWMRSFYERSEKMPNSLENLNELMSGGFKDQWPEFTLANLNRPPVDEYKQADALPHQAKFFAEETITLGGGGARDYTLDGKVKHLSSHDYHYTIGDPNVRSLLFVNTFANGTSSATPTAAVRALVKIGGQWTEEDWTERPIVPFCLDVKAEDVEELIIVISNSEWADRSHVLNPAKQPTLHATNVACRGWTLDATMNATRKGPSVSEVDTVHTTATLTRFVPPASQRHHGELYKVTGGTATWSHTGNHGLCAGKNNGSYGVLNPGRQYELLIESYNLGYLPPFGVGSRQYEMTGSWPGVEPVPLVTYICPNGDVFDHVPNVLMWLHTNRQGSFEQTISLDGQTLEGQITMPPLTDGQTTTTQTYKWKLVALPPE